MVNKNKGQAALIILLIVMVLLSSCNKIVIDPDEYISDLDKEAKVIQDGKSETVNSFINDGELSVFQELIKLGSYTENIRLGGEQRDPQNIIFTDEGKMILPEGKVVTILGETEGRLKRFINISEDKIHELIREIENSKVVEFEPEYSNLLDAVNASAEIILLNTSSEYISLNISLNAKNNHAMIITYEYGDRNIFKYLQSKKVGELIKEIIGWKEVAISDLNDIVQARVIDISHNPSLEFKLTQEEIDMLINAIPYGVKKVREYDAKYKNIIIEAARENGEIINMIWAPETYGLSIEGVHYEFFSGDYEVTDFEHLGKHFGFDPEKYRASGPMGKVINEILVKQRK